MLLQLGEIIVVLLLPEGSGCCAVWMRKYLVIQTSTLCGNASIGYLWVLLPLETYMNRGLN